jgi:hypothetical protein
MGLHTIIAHRSRQSKLAFFKIQGRVELFELLWLEPPHSEISSIDSNFGIGNAQIESATTKFILGANELSTQC